MATHLEYITNQKFNSSFKNMLRDYYTYGFKDRSEYSVSRGTYEPLLGNCVGGNSSSIKSIAESLLETKRKMNQILAKHTGQTEEAVEKATGYDHYFDAEESLKFGLIDEIVDFGKLLEEC